MTLDASSRLEHWSPQDPDPNSTAELQASLDTSSVTHARRVFAQTYGGFLKCGYPKMFFFGKIQK
jgi:hypothetical protein